MANALLDKYKLLKEDVPNYGDNSLLTIRENKLVEPSYGSIVSPPADNTVAQLATANAAAPAESTPTKYFPDTVQALPGSATAPSTPVASTTPAATTTPYTPQTEYEKYWKTPVGTSKYNMPLDQFVKVAGLAAKYLDPQNPIANDLIKMGGEAYNERARREYEGPNVLLERQLRQEQIRKLQEEPPKELEILLKANRVKGIPDDITLKQYIEMKRDKRFAPVITRDNQGNVYSVDKNTGEYTFIGNIGQNVTEQVKGATTGASGDVTTYGKTGKKISVLPGAGKPLVAPGAAGAASDARKQAKEAQEGRKFKTTYKNPETGQLVYETEGTENNPPSHYVVDAKGGYRKATPDELKGLFKVAAEKTKKEAKTNPFGRGEASARPNTRAAMISDLQQRNKGMSKQAVEEYVTKNYPELK
jgi:hypothetical protein